MQERILIVNGDDFGASETINRAILKAHCEGILTSASLLVGGRAFNQAVAIAQAHPRLSVGIHISLVRDRATLPHPDIPQLTDCQGRLPHNPVRAGLRFFFINALKAQLTREMENQIKKFLAAGLTPSHLDGHLNMQMHPTVLSILLKLAFKYSIPAIRLSREELRINLRLDRSHIVNKILHAFIYHLLGCYAEKKMHKQGLFYPDHFFGLLNSGRINTDYLLGVLDHLKPGVTEIGLHPALETPRELVKWAAAYKYREELAALISPRVKAKINKLGIRLANFRLE